MNISNIHDKMRLQRPFVVQIYLYNTAVACLILYLMNQKDIRLDLLRKLEVNPEYTQRELSKEMDVSLGKINYCIKKLTEKGWIKLTSFKQNPNKVGYFYILTPRGIEEKARLTFSFLKRKIKEYEILKDEINKLKEDIGQI